MKTPLVAAPLAPWLVLSPLMIHRIRRRTTQALDTLLVNIAAARKDAR